MGRPSRVCYNLADTKFLYEKDGITYHFSSAFLCDKFIERVEMSRTALNQSLSNRFKFDISVNLIADLTLYARTESRGFYIILPDGGVCECLDNLRFDGGKVMLRS